MSDFNATTSLVGGLPPRIVYSELSAKQKEIYNFQKVAALLADHGFNCIKLADDWQGADFLAYHNDGDHTLKVQLKGRPTIDKKYLGKGLHIAFRIGQDWYLIDHDHFVDELTRLDKWVNTKSWTSAGSYSNAGPGKEIRGVLEPFRLGPSHARSAD